ncbi:8-oxo-dGTP diphosphatase MutT [Porticoccus litoralis]|jgi:8-oxo-dGTP diphosphatase|uniref:8-oxo-dGTP diphosphatase n=1 Tax=Porticoccus litoralis TaxID=434086 RepID=A0AAW8B3A5_9GAMM|nr:8-oxo-dGTP diphosphatase MutT [Porticoccus litoralis]MDP1520024.1 8-oxo-dGTP diphosphatase MutT [Porticoccus litoralis]
MDVVHVAVAVIDDGDGQILIARRPDHVHQGGLWEFPGGKVEPGEAVFDALKREVWEELAIRVEAAEPLIEIRHDYPDKCVLLDVWCVNRFTGVPSGNEGQPLCWVSKKQLANYAFPEANQPIIEAVVAKISC